MSVPLKFVRRLGVVCEAGQHGACVAADSEIGGRHWVCTCDCHEDPAMESWSLIEQALLEAGQPDGLGIVEAVVSLREALCERAERAEAALSSRDDGGSLWSIACEKGDDDETPK